MWKCDRRVSQVAGGGGLQPGPPDAWGFGEGQGVLGWRGAGGREAVGRHMALGSGPD